MSSLFSRWRIFCRERFSLPQHLLLIVFYTAANGMVAWRAAGLQQQLTWRELLCGAVILLTFFHMRIFDEIKDYRTDLVVHKERPLARGLIAVAEAKRASLILILAELMLAALISLPAFAAALCVVIYTLVMYREFFIGDWLRPKMATYALFHTIVSCWMSVFIFAAVTGIHFWRMPGNYLFFVLANWMVFNIYEFGRKTFGKGEEQELVESYSKRFGPWRAALNVIFMAVVATLIAFRFGHLFALDNWFLPASGALTGLVTAIGVVYAMTNTTSTGRMFRGVCSVFILFYNVIIAAGFFFAGR